MNRAARGRRLKPDGVLPPGAGVDLTRSALLFDSARTAGPILVLVGWATFGTALAIAFGGRIVDPADIEAPLQERPYEQRAAYAQATCLLAVS